MPEQIITAKSCDHTEAVLGDIIKILPDGCYLWEAKCAECGKEISVKGYSSNGK